jgi:uncharacterized protein (TIGR02145 family)
MRNTIMIHKNVNLFAVILFCIGLTGCRTNSLKDIDGNVYKTVTIGTQVWMAENLKTTRYNDGTAIPLVTNFDTWSASTTDAYCWYNNDSTNKEVYGALYNWYTVNTKKLCPAGWHVPADAEWTTMANYLEGENVTDSKLTGGKLKEKGTTHWKSPNTGATNESGFTALPGGYRSYNGSFNFIEISGYWWSSTEYSATNVYFWSIRYKYNLVYKYISDKPNGFSVRCLRD